MKIMKYSGWMVAAAMTSYMAIQSDFAGQVLRTASFVSELRTRAEIDQLASEVEELEEEAAEIGLEMDQYEELVAALPNSKSSSGFERRIKHLRSRLLANQVAEGTRVAAIDKAVEPARDLLNRRADRLGYQREGTSFVLVQDKTTREVKSEYTVSPARVAGGCQPPVTSCARR